MKLTFLGAGSAFNKKDGQTNMLLESNNNKKMLIDCGGYCPFALKEYGISESQYSEEIDAIYISHQHGDHISGIEELAFCTYFNPNATKIKFYCEKGLMKELWNSSLKGGLGSLQGKVMHLTDYFDCKPLNVNTKFNWEGIDIQLVQTLHVMNGFEFVPSFGLFAEENDKRIFITTDTQHCPNQIQDFYNMADVIFHDCETAPYFSGVHAHYNELKTLPEETKNKMWLCHYQENPTQNPEEDGFLGFVSQSQVFSF